MNNNYYETEPSQTAGLQINLIKRTYVLPWSQFLFAEGDADEIRMTFSTHDVVVSGGKLDTLLPEIAAQSVSLLKCRSSMNGHAAELGRYSGSNGSVLKRDTIILSD